MIILDEFPRRRFLKQSAAAISALYVPTLAISQDQARVVSANELIPGKHQRLIVHNDKVGEIETPLGLLRDHQWTPKELMFVRNNQVLPGALSLEPASSKDWTIELTGLVSRPVSVSLNDLAKLPQEEIELVLQCSGNGRARFSSIAKADGAQWQNGAMANVKFKGVRVKTVLDHFQIKLDPPAKFVAAEGADSPAMPGTADFEHSLPLNDVLEKSFLALSLSGEPIPKVHGGPVRLVTPGYYATMNVKWLSRLRFEEGESSNHHHVGRYRTPLKPIAPGSKFTSTLDNSEPNWNMRIKSVIFFPLNDEMIPKGKTRISGVAWNDGTAKLEGIEVSVDGGRSWLQTSFQPGSSPYAWYRWHLDVELSSGPKTIFSRSSDALGRCQPVDGTAFWNPAGYGWNGVDRVSVTVG